MNGRLEKWILVGNRMAGDIYGDNKNRFRDGDRILTSSIKNIDMERGVVVTQFSEYQLGRAMNEGATIVASHLEDETIPKEGK